MNYYSYNVGCLITSILMLLILLFKFNKINLCIILLLAAIFSIIWRSLKIIYGKNAIEKDNNHNHSLSNPFFILDFTFATLAYICVLFSKQFNNKLVIISLLIFILAWISNFINNSNNDFIKNKNINSSQTIHFGGHCCVIIIVFVTFYLNIY